MNFYRMRPIKLILIFSGFFHHSVVHGLQVLSKSKLESCNTDSDSKSSLNCSSKIVIDLAVPSESSGKEASIVAEVVEVEENSTNNMQTLRSPTVITVNKSAVYALFELTYIRDVPYKPEELYVKTHKCERDAGADVVQICERLRDENGKIIEQTQPICCPCGDQRRVPSSCGNFCYNCGIDYFTELVDKMVKGKANTAHCLRFPGDWFHVFGIGQQSVGFSIRIEVKTESKISEVVVGPENRTGVSNDNFLRVNLIGDYVGYTNIPTFDNFYLVVPWQLKGYPGQPQNLGMNFSMWMLLERVRFTLDGLECNKIGVGYEAFNGQPDFCSAPFWSCLHNQLWNFWEADQNRARRKQVPLYCVQGRFERINEHPNAGSHSFSIGITEALNTNLLIELSADDIEYVYQRFKPNRVKRLLESVAYLAISILVLVSLETVDSAGPWSPGKILSITIPTFESLTQLGIARITTKNIGEVEASYSLTFDCSAGVSQMEEQFYIMKPGEVLTRSFKLYPTTDLAAKYVCVAILKDSGFNEVDRAECQFTTTDTVVDNGSQIPFQTPKKNINGFFEPFKEMWNKLWAGLMDFITGKTCRMKCSDFFDFRCHIQYICMSWMVMFGLLLAIFPTVVVLLWLLHQKGLFDPLYDWWEDHIWTNEPGIRHKRKHDLDADLPQIYIKKHHKNKTRHHKHDTHKRRGVTHHEHRHNHLEQDNDYHYYLHHGNKEKRKHGRLKGSSIMQQLYAETKDDICGIKNIEGKEIMWKSFTKILDIGMINKMKSTSTSLY